MEIPMLDGESRSSVAGLVRLGIADLSIILTNNIGYFE